MQKLRLEKSIQDTELCLECSKSSMWAPLPLHDTTQRALVKDNQKAIWIQVKPRRWALETERWHFKRKQQTMMTRQTRNQPVKYIDLGNRKNGDPIPQKWNCKEKQHLQREDLTGTWLTCSKWGDSPLPEQATTAENELIIMASVHV